MKQRISDIPPGTEERPIHQYKEKGSLIFLQVNECVLNGQVVGLRAYDSMGNLIIETPLKHGKKHGREYTWNEAGILESIEPYVDGKLHGRARQYGRDGKLIGTYRCIHGTGFDIWRSEREDGSIAISEIHSLRDGLPHGYEWWLGEDQHSVWHECHWQQGVLHGIERMWNSSGTLKRGYPKFWIHGQAVSKRVYLKAAERDKYLPIFRAEDNLSSRRFPAQIEKLLSGKREVYVKG